MKICEYCGTATALVGRVNGRVACKRDYDLRTVGMLAKSDIRRRHIGGAFKGGWKDDDENDYKIADAFHAAEAAAMG